MTDLNRIRADLQRTPAYDPAKPVRRDLLEQIVNDLAFQFGTDASYVMELFEQIASDTGVDHDPKAVTPEQVLKAMFDVLAPYQSRQVTRPTPIEYVAVKFPDNTIDMSRRDQIQEMAIQECGWPMGTVARIQGQRFELCWAHRMAYVLWQPGGNFLIPRYNEALSRHIEKRDAAYGLEPDDEDDDPHRALTDPPFGPGVSYRSRSFLSPSMIAKIKTFGAKPLPAIPPPTYSKRYHTIVVDDAIEEDKTVVSVAERDRIVATWFAEELGQRIKKAFEKVAEGAKQAETVVIDSLAKVQAELKAMIDDLDDEIPALEPIAAPARPARTLQLPGHPRSPERRSRAPPGAGNRASIGTMAGPRDTTRGLRLFWVLRSVKIEDLRKILTVPDVRPKVPPETERCPVDGCFNRAIVPDGGVLFCSEHHFKCNTRIEGKEECFGRVPQLGMVCKPCQKKGRRERDRARGGRYGPRW